MTTKDKIETLWEEESERGQNKNLSGCYKIGEGTFKVNVRLDTSYDFQSTASIARWDGTQWHSVASILAQNVQGRTQAKKELISRALLVVGH